MKFGKNRIAAITIAMLMIISMGASLMLVPTASAHTPAWNIPTFAYITVAPNPVGVGQTVTVYMWLDKVFDVAMLINPYRFHNYQLTITAPDGTKTTQTWAIVSDPTSSQYTTYTPSAVGTYTLNFTFPGQLITTSNDLPTSAYINDTYLPSSASTTLTVQSTAIPAAIGSSPMPTAYWTRPIYGENTNWYTISSNWLGTGRFPFLSPDTSQAGYPGDAVGPQTSHIMWTKPLQSGGVVGGTTNTSILGDTYFEGSAYNLRFSNPIIIDGMLYYTEPVSFAGASSGPTDCVNLQTGQLIWSSTAVPALSFGYIYDVQDPNQHGVYPPMLVSISGTTWQFYAADTGDPLFNVTNVPSGTIILGPSGEYLILTLTNYPTATNPYNWYLAEWNSSRLWDNEYSGPSTSPSVVPPITNGAWTGGYGEMVIGPPGTPPTPVYMASLYDWNISIPSLTTAPTILDAFYNNMAICENGTLPGLGAWSPYTYFAINLKAASGIGSILWTQTEQPPAGNITVLTGTADPTADSGHGVFFESYKETLQFVGYSMATGAKLWGPTAPQTAFDYYGTPYIPSITGTAAYGNLYSSSFGGIIYCYNLTTGNIDWTYGNGGAGNSTRSGFNVPYGDYPTFIEAIGNGIIYTLTTEHTVETPIYKGALARAVNATDGAQIWTLSNYGSSQSYAIADGYATIFNGYDQQIYCIGRGPSATTVTAPDVGVTTSTPVVIRGTVMDISAGTKQAEQAADFPNGVPCASDASMTAWMGYVYQQQPEPSNFTGVQVQISVLDSNGNHYDIGTATTNVYGAYSLTWTPIIPGNFTVYATFAGTNGYWPSSASTNFYASAAAPTPAPTASPPTGLASTSSLELGIAAVIIVIIIIGVILALLMLRKRP